jgi:hypothetical protein
MRSEAYRIGLAFGTGLEKNAGFLGNIGRWMASRGSSQTLRNMFRGLPDAAARKGKWKGVLKAPVSEYPEAVQQQLRHLGTSGVGMGLGATGLGYGIYKGYNPPEAPPQADPAAFMQMMQMMQQQQQPSPSGYEMPREINILR